MIVLLGLALVDFVAHMLVSGNYGYFRDELYYIEAGRHLAFGYVDFPPLIALVAKFLDLVTGDALWAIHVVPALATALIVLITGLMARELGGGRFAQALAALASLAAVTFLATGSLFSMDALDELWWVLASYVLILILKRNDSRLWLLFGLIAGVGLTTKVTMLFFGLAVVLGLLLTPARRQFGIGWIWLGGVIAIAFLLPYVLWNMANGWPTLEFFGNYEGSGGSLEFLLGQIPGMNPFTLPLSLAGLYFYLGNQRGRSYRALGWTFVVLVLVLALLGAKPYTLAPAYPMLYAGGSIIVGQLSGRMGRLLKPVYVVLLLISAILLAPLAMPILPPSTFTAAYGSLSGTGDTAAGQDTQGAFPQYLGDRFGWENMTRTVASVYDDLPTEERARACIFTSNYGEASALNFLGGRYGLPPAISGHNNYYLWGPDGCAGEVMITVGVPKGDVEQIYTGVERAATITCRYCVPEEGDVAVYVASRPRFPIRELWPQAKHYE
ncbi:MAG: glycosyltransferase family 39 protein [Actinomycetota bacterium]|nr:glycosyltransferase family 39 protein [Actinomycetota bacterium]